MRNKKTFEDLFEENFNLIPKFEDEKLIFKFQNEIYEITFIMYYDKKTYCWKNYTGNMKEIIDTYFFFSGFDNKKLSFFVPYSLYTDEPKHTLYFDTITPMPNNILTFNLLNVHEKCDNKCGLIIRRTIYSASDYAESVPFLVPDRENFLSEEPFLSNVDREHDRSNILKNI